MYPRDEERKRKSEKREKKKKKKRRKTLSEIQKFEIQTNEEKKNILKTLHRTFKKTSWFLTSLFSSTFPLHPKKRGGEKKEKKRKRWER